MPEGDSIRKLAHRLSPALVGERVLSARANDFDAEPLVGKRLLAVRTHGKHLFVEAEGDLVVSLHLGMRGRVRVLAPLAQLPGLAQIALQTSRSALVVTQCRTAELRTRRAIERDTYLARLGPDLLAPGFSGEEAIRRLRASAAVACGEAIMDQTVLAGIGNVYKSELLFLERIHPTTPVGELSEAALGALVARASKLLARNLGRGPRRTRQGGDGVRLWVYRRAGERCLVCDTRIEVTRQGALRRSTYFCPSCQGA